MLAEETIRAAVSRLVSAATSPARVIQFGSRARGAATEESDLDLMVIEQEMPDKAAEYLRLRRALGRIAPLAEFERRSQAPSTVLFEARLEGMVLHDALH